MLNVTANGNQNLTLWVWAPSGEATKIQAGDSVADWIGRWYCYPEVLGSGSLPSAPLLYLANGQVV